MSLEEDRRILKSGHPENFQFVEENYKYYDPDQKITEAQLKQFEESQKEHIESLRKKIEKEQGTGEVMNGSYEEIEEIDPEEDRRVLREEGSLSHMQNFDEVERKTGAGILEADRQVLEEQRKAEISEDKKILGQNGKPGKVKESWSESISLEAVDTGGWFESEEKEFKISGTAIVPGLSLNNKRYSEQAIGKAYERAKKRVEAGKFFMKSGHRKKGSDETSPLVRVGRLTEIGLNDESEITFEAILGSTSLSKDMRSALQDKLAGQLSIEAEGSLRRNSLGEEEVGEDFDILALDFVQDSGVVKSRVENILRN